MADSMPANIPPDIFGMVDRGYRHFLKSRGLSDHNYANNSSARHAENKRKRLEAAKNFGGASVLTEGTSLNSNDNGCPVAAAKSHKTRGPKALRRGSSPAQP